MRVEREDLTGTAMQKLIVTDDCGTIRHVGEVAGYYCPECEQADETLTQIYHDADCSHAGEHGRAVYDEPLDADDDGDGKQTPEFRDDTPITLIKYGETEGRGGRGLHKGEVIGFMCDSCSNADETVFEIVHDDRCPLSTC